MNRLCLYTQTPSHFRRRHCYHVRNRANARDRIFGDDDDYLAIERIIERSLARLPMRNVGYCLMPNHRHMVLWPKEDGQLSEFMRLLTVTHTQRWHANRRSAGISDLQCAVAAGEYQRQV